MLKELELDDIKFIKISPFKSKFSVKNVEGRKVLHFFLVHLSSNSNINKLKAIVGLLHRVVKWEPLKSSEIFQYRNCHDTRKKQMPKEIGNEKSN